MKTLQLFASQETRFSVSQLNRQIQQFFEASLPWCSRRLKFRIWPTPAQDMGFYCPQRRQSPNPLRHVQRPKNSRGTLSTKRRATLVRCALCHFYVPRGAIANSASKVMESAGEGALQQAFERPKPAYSLKVCSTPSTQKSHCQPNLKRVAIFHLTHRRMALFGD